MNFSNLRVAISISLLFSVLSCGKQADAPPSAATTAQPAAPTEAAPTAPATAATPAAQAPPALASAEGELPGLRVELQELKRTAGDTLTLKLVFANTGQKDVVLDAFGAQEVYSIGGIHLIDIEGKKKYFVASDADGKCLCSRDLGRVNPGARVSLWAKFPAPPADVQKISVVVPHFAPIEEIPIDG